MIEFPGTEKEVRQLERFLTATENTPSSAELDDMRTRALAYAERLSNAVSIGFAGEFGAGKSSLANMLAGADILPTGPQHLKLPLVIVAYAETPETTVGWWNKEPKVYAGVALEKAALDDPDFISVGLNTPALQEISLFDLPGAGALDDTYKQTLGLLDYVDCAIWCTNGTNAWRETERHLWSQVPQKLRDNSLMAVTHADLPPVRDSLDRVVSRLNKEKGELFRAVVPIGTPVAVRAMEQEPEPDFDLWETCGGQNLAEQVLRVASDHRRHDLEAARKDLAEEFLPYMEKLTGAAQESDTEADGKTVLASLETALPPLDNPILEDWLAAIASIYNDLRESSDIEPAAFLQSCQEIVEDFSERLESGAEIDPKGDWIPAEFEKATDLLLLLQFESGDAPLKDAISILAQLSDNLAWAGSTVASAPSRTGT
ncbi:Dynamin family protein [Ruegeria halocynthiae]|uniref:Dynamin family protein n=1 Tax=Ruegeria halocynthiae TaxID=985054 RepID=A0A1H2YAF5_9RHOB|nr:dynamin family protein [Ruegeria halocynthiae]SDX01644.1 Dynamin family protein [Ruegeria halocynthiae]